MPDRTLQSQLRYLPAHRGNFLMSTIAALPPTLHQRLALLARRVRRLRALRGLSLLVVLLVLGGAAALLADAGLGLPGWARSVLLVGWLGLGAFVAVSDIL